MSAALLLALLPPPPAAAGVVVNGPPRVLLIGDSISIGYGPAVRRRLRGAAEVVRISGNGRHTRNGLAKLEEWLGEERWDVIHVNFGLHDLKRVGPAGSRQVSPEEYRRNLAVLLDRLRRTGAAVVWATTTPVPPGASDRAAGDAARYNAVAAGVLDGRPVRVNDLFAVAAARPALQKPRDVHFTDAGSRVLGRAVADAVAAALAGRAASPREAP